ncbi:MAG: LPS export ABC transporter permease LptG [Pseudomonadota bacterium]
MILHAYFARRFLGAFSAVFAVFLLLFVLIDMVEQTRKFDSDAVGFLQIFRLTLLNVPQGLYAILPLLMILATLTLFLSLARTSEMVITRASGRSALRSLVAPVIMAVLIGAVCVAVFNPIVASTSRQYEVLAGQLSGDATSVLSISAEGLWLRQGSAEGQTVINAAQANLDGTTLYDVTFLAFDSEGTPVERIEAARATLEPGAWALEEAKVWALAGSDNPERDARQVTTLSLASDLTQARIQDSFATPASIPIWDLPAFISRLEKAGFSARTHKVWLQRELALPLTMVGMVLVAAGFTMRHTRFGRTGMMVLFAVSLGFAIHFLRNFAQILGDNGQLPVWLAAWTVPVAAVLLSLGLLLHLEDG